MSGSSRKPWSINPNAPRIPRSLYDSEKASFAGQLAGAMFYGIVVVLFFQCMGALLNPINRTNGSIQWWLVAHTVAMFSFVTISTAMSLDLESISYVDNREFFNDSLPPGPLGYQLLMCPKAISVVPVLMLLLNQWLADGLLLYRCFAIYIMNYWAIAFPCLMYLASLATGITYLYQSSRPGGGFRNLVAIHDFGLPYYSISLSLNVLLTLMIVIRLILYYRSTRSATGTLFRTGGLYTAVVTVLVESSALYAVSCLLSIGPSAADNAAGDVFLLVLAETQVIAPFLITLRVANQRALTRDTLVAGSIGSIHFGSRGKSAGDGGVLHDGYPMSSVDANGRTSCELDVGVGTTVGEVSSLGGLQGH